MIRRDVWRWPPLKNGSRAPRLNLPDNVAAIRLRARTNTLCFVVCVRFNTTCNTPPTQITAIYKFMGGPRIPEWGRVVKSESLRPWKWSMYAAERIKISIVRTLYRNRHLLVFIVHSQPLKFITVAKCTESRPCCNWNKLAIIQWVISEYKGQTM